MIAASRSGAILSAAFVAPAAGITTGYSLGRALEVLPIGTAYVVWTGIGAVGTVVIGIVVFNEPAGMMRLLWIAVTLAGIIGLKVTSQ